MSPKCLQQSLHCLNSRKFASGYAIGQLAVFSSLADMTRLNQRAPSQGVILYSVPHINIDHGLFLLWLMKLADKISLQHYYHRCL